MPEDPKNMRLQTTFYRQAKSYIGPVFMMYNTINAKKPLRFKGIVKKIALSHLTIILYQMAGLTPQG